MSADTVARTATLAMHAVTQHALDQRLEVWGIDTPFHWREDEGLTVKVPADAFDAWVETLNAPADPAVDNGDDGWLRMACSGWVPSPIGDVRVTIRTSRKVTPLHAVGGA